MLKIDLTFYQIIHCYFYDPDKKGILQTLWNMKKCLLLAFTHHVFNPYPNKPWFLCIYSTSLLKTLPEKKKLLIMSNFSFFHSVFYPHGNFLPFSSNLKLSSANSFWFSQVVLISLSNFENS